MKSIKSILLITFVLISGVCFADGPGCDQYTSIYDSNLCNSNWVKGVKNHFIALGDSLHRDDNKLGVTKEEKDAIVNYAKALFTDVKARCGAADFDCHYDAYANGYQELKAFEVKKKQEKQARMQPAPKLTLNTGKSQVAVKPSGMSQAEIARRNEEEVGD